MPGDFTPWGTNEWEDHIQKVLKRRYKSGGYQEIPAETHGDHGLEGFSSDGNAYQCYSAQDYTDPAELVKKQKGKITADIGKFLANEQQLVQMFGPLQIRRWYLIVPYWKNKDLITHAKLKQASVRKAKPKHAHPEFEILIHTGEDYLVEKQELASAGNYSFSFLPPEVDGSSLDAWLENSSNLELIKHLDLKAPLIVGDRPNQLPKIRAWIVKTFILGGSLLISLQKELPETSKRIAELKRQKEVDLLMETATSQSVPPELFRNILESFKDQLIKTPGLSESVAIAIANEAVADWVLRCPLEF